LRIKLKMQKQLVNRSQGNQQKIFLSLIWLVLIFFYQTAYASTPDKEQVINVVADTLQFNNESKIGIYQGHIIITQATRVLTADYAISYSNQEGKIIKIIARGHPACYRALIFHKRPKLIATGNTIYYYPLKDWLEAVGDAKIIQDKNHFQGPQINYDFKRKTVGSPLSKEGHTQILLSPLQSLHS
jgi:lipopolysaccharide export system protein LptA